MIFFNKNKKTINDDTTDKNSSNEINEKYFLFVNKLLGFKEIPYNTYMLLVNDYINKTLNIVYEIEKSKQTIKIPISQISNISYESKVKINSVNKKAETNEMKSQLLSMAVFGGSPLIQFAGGAAFNTLFNTLSNNYSKVELNTTYELVIEFSLNGESTKFIFTCETNPSDFINLLKNNN